MQTHMAKNDSTFLTKMAKALAMSKVHNYNINSYCDRAYGIDMWGPKKDLHEAEIGKILDGTVPYGTDAVMLLQAAAADISNCIEKLPMGSVAALEEMVVEAMGHQFGTRVASE